MHITMDVKKEILEKHYYGTKDFYVPIVCGESILIQ